MAFNFKRGYKIICDLLLGASTAAQAYGAVSSSNTAKAWGNYQKKHVQQDALNVLSVSQIQANKIREQAELQRGSAVSATAGSGVVVGEGTAAQVENRIVRRGEYDAQTALYDGRDAAARILVQGDSANIRAKQEAKASLIGGATSILGTVAASSNWNKSTSSKNNQGSQGVQKGPSSSQLINKQSQGFGFYKR